MEQTLSRNGLKMKVNINNIIAYLLCTSAIIHVSILFQVEYLLGGRWHMILYLIMYACVLLSYLFVIVDGRLYVGSSILIPFFCWAFYTFHVYEKIDWNLNSFILLAFLLFFFVSPEVRYKAFMLFRKFVIVMSVFGVILYVLNFLSVHIPFDIVQYYAYYGLTDGAANKSWYYNFRNLIFLQGTAGYAIRLSGFFNEPGLNGTICALLLCADSYKIKKIGNLILFFAGMSTLSLAFIFISITYFVLYMKKNYKQGIVILILLIIAFTIFSHFEFNNDTLSYLQERLTFQNGKLAGNSRKLTSETYELLRETLLNKPLLGNGRGYTGVKTGEINVANLIIDYGIIGLLIMYVPVLILGVKRAKGSWEAISFVFCFWVSILQRYDIIAIEYFLIYFGGLEWVKYKNEMIIRFPVFNQSQSEGNC